MHLCTLGMHTGMYIYFYTHIYVYVYMHICVLFFLCMYSYPDFFPNNLNGCLSVLCQLPCWNKLGGAGNNTTNGYNNKNEIINHYIN